MNMNVSYTLMSKYGIKNQNYCFDVILKLLVFEGFTKENLKDKL